MITQPQDNLLVFSLAETSRRSDLSLATLHRKIAAGELESIKVGRRRLIPFAALSKLIGLAA